MSFSCTDTVSILAELLEGKGYKIHNGNAETGETVDDESGDDWWFTWAVDGMADCEVGPTCAEQLGATTSAMEHFFQNADILVYSTFTGLRNAARSVIENWEKGDLAGAVHLLEGELDRADESLVAARDGLDVAKKALEAMPVLGEVCAPHHDKCRSDALTIIDLAIKDMQ